MIAALKWNAPTKCTYYSLDIRNFAMTMVEDNIIRSYVRVITAMKKKWTRVTQKKLDYKEKF